MHGFYSRNLVGREAVRLAEQVAGASRSAFDRTDARHKASDAPEAVRITLPSGRTLEYSHKMVTLLTPTQERVRVFEGGHAELLWQAAAGRLHLFRSDLEVELALRIKEAALNPGELVWDVSWSQCPAEFGPLDTALLTGRTGEWPVLTAKTEGASLLLMMGSEGPWSRFTWRLHGALEDDVIKVESTVSACWVSVMARQVLLQAVQP